MIDINRKYRYRNGGEARILCVDRPCDNGFSVVSCDKKGDLHTHTPDGLYGNSTYNHLFDLIEEKRVFWANVYNDGRVIYTHTFKTEADKQGGQSRIARIKVEYEEGQFDE